MHANKRFLGSLLALAAVVLVAAWAAAPAPAPRQPAPAQAPNRAAIEKIIREYLLAHPELLEEVQVSLIRKREADAERARRQGLAQVGLPALLDPKIAYVTGPANAKVTIVEFFDYHCGFCKASLPAVKAILARGNVRFAFVEYPILTAESLVAAQAAVAARRQSGPKYLAFHFALMNTSGALPRERLLEIARGVGLDIARLQRDMQDTVTQASVKASQEIAQRLHLDGTPSFVINNKVVVGQLTEAEMSALIKAAGG
jgi:protein-disulfide isomerase